MKLSMTTSTRDGKMIAILLHNLTVNSFFPCSLVSRTERQVLGGCGKGGSLPKTWDSV